MNSIGTLVGVRFVGAQKPLVHALGLNAAVFLNECIYWQVKAGIGNWFSRTIPQFTDDTGLSKSEQATVRTQLIKLGLIEEQKGVQYRTQTRINVDRFNEFLDSIQPQEIVQLAAQNRSASRSKPDGSYNRERTGNKQETDESAFNPIDLIEQNQPEYARFVEEGSYTPYKVWEAYCRGRKLSTDHLVGNQLVRQLHHAKTIIKDGIPLDDVEHCASWLHSQEWWRKTGFDLTAITKQYARWVSLGKPKAEQIVGAKPIRGTTPSL
jgi:hypothetical protein